MVTAEFALASVAAIPVVFALLAMLLAGVEQVRVVESARSAARMIARGQTPGEAQEMVARTLPASHVEIERRGDDVVVHVRRSLDPAGLFPALTLRATAVTPAERYG